MAHAYFRFMNGIEGQPDNLRVILHAIQYSGDFPENMKPNQFFNRLYLCPVLVVDPFDEKWKTKGEILLDKAKRGWPSSMHEAMDNAVAYFSTFNSPIMTIEQAQNVVYNDFMMDNKNDVNLFSDLYLRRIRKIQEGK